MPLPGILASQITGHLNPTTGFCSIETATVGSGGQPSITFSSIPQIYKHLQVRVMSRSTNASYYSQIFFKINGATSYYRHLILADGVNNPPGAYGYTAQPNASLGYLAGNNVITNSFGVAILDILDYTNTNKYKTYKGLFGLNNNSQASPDTYMGVVSGTYSGLDGINSLVFTPESGSFAQYTSFALYGIQG